MAREDGRYISIQFDRPIYGDVESNINAFRVFVEQRAYATYPDGSLVYVEVPIVAIRKHPVEENAIQLEFGSGNANSLQKCAGRIMVRYQNGTLYGNDGPVLSFSETFEPEGIAYRGDVSDGEHFTILSATSDSIITAITYSSYSYPGEHFTMCDAHSSHVLTHIDNI